MITKVNVHFNGEKIPVKSILDYGKLYSKESKEEAKEFLRIKYENSEVYLTSSKNPDIISFANGIHTPLGGTHVDSWSEEIFRPIVKRMSKKGKPTINIKDVKNLFFMVVISSVKNPTFDSQSKFCLESPKVPSKISSGQLSKIMKWSIKTELETLIKSKEMGSIKKIERKKNGYTHIATLDKANKEGGKTGHKCTLMLVEGMSAKTYAVQGIGKKGRDYYGIYPLRGKLLNTRNASAKSIKGNKEICDIIQALNLQRDVDYTIDKNYKKLRYGRILILTDGDVDGIHINSLIQNFFHSLYPSLLEREEPFITFMQTPIVKVMSGKKERFFFDENEYKKYVRKYKKKYPNKTLNFKYYKGLGTSSVQDVKKCFGKKMVEFEIDDEITKVMNKAFHGKFSDARKEWLSSYDPTKTILKWKGNEKETLRISHSDFKNGV